MCNFFSCIYTKRGTVLYKPNADSHEDIIELYELNDDNYPNKDWVRIEAEPDCACKNAMERGHFLPEDFIIKLDEEEAPKWFKLDKAIKAVIKTLNDNSIINRVDNIGISTPKIYIINSNVILEKNSFANFIYRSNVEIIGGNFPEIINSTINIHSNPTIDIIKDCYITNISGSPNINRIFNSIIHEINIDNTIDNITNCIIISCSGFIKKAFSSFIANVYGTSVIHGYNTRVNSMHKNSILITDDYTNTILYNNSICIREYNNSNTIIMSRDKTKSDLYEQRCAILKIIDKRLCIIDVTTEQPIKKTDLIRMSYLYTNYIDELLDYMKKDLLLFGVTDDEGYTNTIETTLP